MLKYLHMSNFTITKIFVIQVEQPKEAPVAKKKEKKEQLTKAQKRKQADRVGRYFNARPRLEGC